MRGQDLRNHVKTQASAISLALGLAMSGTVGCVWQGDLDVSDTHIVIDPNPDSKNSGTDTQSTGVLSAEHVNIEFTSTLGRVVYPSSTVATGYSTEVPTSQNNLYKYAHHKITVTVDHPDPVTDVELVVDGGQAESQHPTNEVPHTVVFDLDTTRMTEGPYQLEVTIRTAPNGVAVTVPVPFQVVLNATDVEVVAERWIWATTLDAGLLTYDLGDDPLDPSDDIAFGVPFPASIYHPTSYGNSFSIFSPEFLRLSRDEANRFWIGTAWGGVLLFDDGGTPIDPGDDQWVRFSFPPCGTSYVCGEDRVDPTPDTLEGLVGKALANTVTDIEPVGTDGAYVATLSGLHYLQLSGDPFYGKPKITSFSSKGRYDANIAALKRDSDGRLWIASFDITGEGAADDALTVFDPGVSPFDHSDDQWAKVALFPFDAPEYVYSLAIDHNGLKWLGTDQGLFTLNDSNTPFEPTDDVWTLREQNAGLADPDVGAVVVREDGALLVGGFDVCSGNGGGLAVVQLGGVDPQEVDQLLAGGATEWIDVAMDPTADQALTIYTMADGLPDPDVSSIMTVRDNIVVISTFNILKAWILDVVLEAYGIDAGSCDAAQPGTLGLDGITVLDMGDSLLSKDDDRILNL